METPPKCNYCTHNEGENKKLGFMWYCRLLGYCIPFGWHRCEAQHLDKGDFELDEVKYKESKLTYISITDMKATPVFETTIQEYLEARAKKDELFAVSYAKAGKSIKDCCTYILNTVKASGCSGFAADEVYSMAVHYYDEDNIEVGSPVQAKVVVNTSMPMDKPTKEKPTKTKASKPVVDANSMGQQLNLFGE